MARDFKFGKRGRSVDVRAVRIGFQGMKLLGIDALCAGSRGLT